MADDDLEIGIEMVDKTGTATSSVVSNAQKITSEYEKAGQAVDEFSLKAAAANQRAANSFASLAKSNQSGKNSWYNPSASDAVNMQAAASAAAAKSQIADVAAIKAAEDKRYQSIVSTRYALYDVASTYRQVSVAATATLAAVVGTGMSFEDAFTGVERTADLPVQKLEELRQQLVSLSTEIPVAFTNLSEISTLGGQLGIAGQDLDGFAENVAMFSATTNASIDATATGFGRLAQLTDAGTESFNEIGSAIYTVGVNSVATETEIMNVAQEIATAGNLAGFSADEIIGLSGALASLGVQPERARGNIQRIFAEIDGAANEGGAALDNFAKLSGKTSNDFVKSWKDAPSDTFVSLIDGLGNVANSGQSLDGVLSDLGIKAVRDVQTMKQLADNTELLHQTMTDANTAYGEATSLQDAYGSTADNLSSKLTELLNSVKGILDELSQNAALGVVVDALKEVTNGFLKALQVAGPFGDALGFVVTTGTLAAGVFGAVTAASMTLRAGYLAMLTAQNNLTASGATLDLSLKNMLKSLAQMAFTSRGAVNGLNNVSAAAERTAVATSQAGAAQSAASSGGGVASMLAGWAKGGAIMLGVSAAMWGASKAVSTLSLALGPASERAAQFGLSFEGLGSALKSDMETFKSTGDAVAVFKTQANGSLQVIPGWTTGMHSAAEAQALLAQQTKTSTGEIQNQIVVMGQQSAAAIAQQVGSNATLTDLFQKNASVINEAGLSYEGYVQALAAGQGDAYIAKLQAAVDGWGEAASRNSLITDENASHYAEYLEKAEQGQSLVDHLTDTTDTLSEALGINANSAEYTARAQEALGVSSSDAGDSMADLVDTAQSLADTLFGGANASASFEGAMYDLGNSLYTNGADFSAYSDAGRANLSALATVVNAAANAAGDDANALATNLTAILNSLSGYGVNVAQMFPQLVSKASVGYVNKLNAAMSQQSVTAGYAAAQNKAYSSAAKSAGNSASAAAKKVYTLSDYVSDLSSVMKKAFDFRFGLDQSTDDLADAFQKLVDMKQDAQDAVTDAFSGLEDARKNVRDLRVDLQGLQADLNGLYADQGTLQYQLGVAIDYGDTLRQNEILAELEKNSADIASKQNDMTNKSKDLGDAQNDVSKATSDLDKAQQDAVRTLDGGTVSSRKQRDAVLDLVQSYQDQVVALANTGMNQQQLQAETEKLRQRFVEQMKQLGYNSTEIDKYSQSFTNLITVIDAVPRNITLSANADPAQRAINEFIAANTNGRGASSPLNTPITSSFNDAGVQKAARAQELFGQISKWQAEYTSAMASGDAMRIRGANYTLQAIDQYSAKLRSGNYYNGGFTGRGGTREIAGVAHKGEWIARQNQTDQNTGLPYPSVLASLLASYGYGSSSTSTGTGFSGTIVAELSPTDRNLLRQAFNRPVNISFTDVANANARAVTSQSNRGGA